MNKCYSYSIQVAAYILGLYLWSSMLVTGWSTPAELTHQPPGTYFVRYQLMRDNTMVHVIATQETPVRPHHIDITEHHDISLSYWLVADPNIKISFPSSSYRKLTLSCEDALSYLLATHDLSLDFDCDPNYPVLIRDLGRPKQVDLLVSVNGADPIAFSARPSLTARWLVILCSSTLLYVCLFLCARAVLLRGCVCYPKN